MTMVITDVTPIAPPRHNDLLAEFILKNGTKVKVIPVYRWGAQHPQLEEKIVDKIKAFLV